MAFKRMLKRNTTMEKTFEFDDESTYSVAKALPSKTPASSPAAQDKESTFGTNAIIKTFYKHHKKGWTETPPKQTSSKTTKVYDRVAIKVYKRPDLDQPKINERPSVKVQSVEIQSPILIAALKDIFKPLGTFVEEHETANFEAPFKPLYFAYDSIMDLYDRTYNETILKEHLHLLTGLMNELFGSMMTRLRHLRESGLICYDLAWTYFPKGSNIYCGAKGCERLYRVLGTEHRGLGNEHRAFEDDYYSGKGILTVSCEEIAFDGYNFAWKTTSFEIRSFSGIVPVTSLSAYPLSFHKSVDLLKAKLIARGKLVLDYQELKYREYSGTGKSDDPQIKRHNVSRRR